MPRFGDMEHPFFSAGHSTRPIEEFMALLRSGSVELVVDIRTVPRSRTNPQYNTDTAADRLALYQVGYTHIPELGGLRKRREADKEDINAFWNNQSFRNYADYAMSQTYQEGLARLIRLGRERRVAMMCAEAVWWRCHRRIVADYLLSRGEAVFHLMGEARVEPAKITPGARAQPGGMITYPSR